MRVRRQNGCYVMDKTEAENETEDLRVCAGCESPDAREVFAGDEGLTVCPGCNAIEQGYKYLNEAEQRERGLL